MKESSEGETLMAVGIWSFQIWGAAEEKVQRPKLVFGSFLQAGSMQEGLARGTQQND